MKRASLALLFAVLVVGLPNLAVCEWMTEVVDRLPSGGNGGESSSIAVDSEGAIHIASHNQSLVHALQYSTNASGSWETIALDWATEDSSTAIAVDSSGKVHICYFNGYLPTHLRYATNASGTWVTSYVDEHHPLTWGTGKQASIVVDGADRVHILYAEKTSLLGGEHHLKHATNLSGVWAIETLGTGYGSQNSIAVDSADKVHVSYTTTDGLVYASNASGAWVHETAAADLPAHHSIAVDGSNNTHVCYTITGSPSELIYATRTSGTWEMISLGSAHPHYPHSIVADGFDGLHIAYTWEGIKLATNSSGTWVTESVAAGSGSSIALSGSDEVHISYWAGGLDYATNASGVWATTALPSPGDLGLGTSVVLDDLERVHVSYIDETNETLKYSTNASGEWVTESVCPSQGMLTSIALDGSGKVHISYGSGGLAYATNASGAWVTESVDPESGSSSSIAVDTAGNIHISYGKVMYATNSSGAWVTETVESEWNIEGPSSIALDSSDKVHIAYVARQYELEDSVKYVRKVSGAWVTEVLDSTQASACSIALDSSDRAHITYRRWDGENESLRYTTNAYGAWVEEAVESMLGVGWDISIALDRSDKAYISYTGEVGFLPPYFTLPALKVATNASGRWETWAAYSNHPMRYGEDNSIAVGSSGSVYMSHHGSDGTLLLTSGTPPASSGWGPASTMESESRGSHAFPTYLLLLGIPVGAIFLWRARSTGQR